MRLMNWPINPIPPWWISHRLHLGKPFHPSWRSGRKHIDDLSNAYLWQKAMKALFVCFMHLRGSTHINGVWKLRPFSMTRACLCCTSENRICGEAFLYFMEKQVWPLPNPHLIGGFHGIMKKVILIFHPFMWEGSKREYYFHMNKWVHSRFRCI